MEAGQQNPNLSFEELYEQARHSDGMLGNVGSTILSDLQQSNPSLFNGIDFELGELKEVTRATEKIKGDYGGDHSKISDLVRGRIVVDNAEQVEAIRNYLNEHLEQFGIEKFKDQFAEPTDTGFRAINTKIRLPNGHIAEFRVEHRGMLQAADHTHTPYERVQEIERRAEVEGRFFTEEEALERQQLLDQVRDIHGEPAARDGLDRLLNEEGRAKVQAFQAERVTPVPDTSVRYVRSNPGFDRLVEPIVNSETGATFFVKSPGTPDELDVLRRASDVEFPEHLRDTIHIPRLVTEDRSVLPEGLPDTVVGNGGPVMVVEAARGVELQELEHNGKGVQIQESDWARFREAVEYMNEQGVVHGDLKNTSNIYVSFDENGRTHFELIDWGGPQAGRPASDGQDFDTIEAEYRRKGYIVPDIDSTPRAAVVANEAIPERSGIAVFADTTFEIGNGDAGLSAYADMDPELEQTLREHDFDVERNMINTDDGPRHVLSINGEDGELKRLYDVQQQYIRQQAQVSRDIPTSESRPTENVVSQAPEIEGDAHVATPEAAQTPDTEGSRITVEAAEIKPGFTSNVIDGFRDIGTKSGIIGGAVMGTAAGVLTMTLTGDIKEAAEVTFETAVPYGETALDVVDGDMEAAAHSATVETAATVGGVAGAMAGATAGAAIGSVVPIVGTAVGGVAGGIVGAVGGGVVVGAATDYVLNNGQEIIQSTMNVVDDVGSSVSDIASSAKQYLSNGFSRLFNDSAAPEDSASTAVVEQTLSEEDIPQIDAQDIEIALAELGDFGPGSGATHSGDLLCEAQEAGLCVDPALLPPDQQPVQPSVVPQAPQV